MTSILIGDEISVAVAPGEVLLAPVTFHVEAGTALAVVGPNGSGKTTLLRVLAGAIRPTAGRVAIAAAPVDERDPGFRSRVAALIGPPPMARNLTVREHLVLVATSWGSTIAEAENHADGLLGDLGLGHLAARFTHELSSGQVQLSALALTLARPFEVLVVDEPEQRLDPGRLELVTALFVDLVKAGKTLVVASHSTGLVERIGDQVLEVTIAGHHQRG